MDREMHKGRSILTLACQRQAGLIFLALLCCSLPVPSTLLGASLSRGLSHPLREVEGSALGFDGELGRTAQQLITEKTPDLGLSANPAINTEPLPSSSVADTFFEIASEITNSADITATQAEQAIVLLIAAKELGSTNEQIQPLLIKLACESAGGGQQDYSQQVYLWLDEYASESIDFEVAKKAIRYLLDRLNSRENRERLLQDLLSRLGGKNAALDSELYTLLGLLMVEKADFKTAQSNFVRAYFNNKYNKLAFSKLAELLPERVGPTIYLEHLRLVLRENPLDIETALAFANYAERLQLYEIAAAAYQHSADLFSYLYPNEPLPPDIYLPWTISNYNTAQNQYKCLQIADHVRRSGRFDIFVEAIAGKAAMKIGNIQEASQIFHAAEQKAQQLLDKKFEIPTDGGFGAKQLAWFYCFAFQDAGKALDWSNKAYSTDPNSAIAAALLAYALVINQQLEWAKPLTENYEQNQIADLVRAQIQLTDGQRELAIETLKSAIAKDPGSLAAERAKEILAMQGEEYIAPVDPDVVLTVLSNNFGQAIVPEFISPEKIISVQFNIRGLPTPDVAGYAKAGNEFPFGNKFGGTVAIVNNSSEPFVISDDGIFQGNIQIDANISGDLNKRIPKLVSHKIDSPSLVEPGKTILIPLRLVTGELRRILFGHPQASLDIEFTLYLDPAPATEGRGTSHEGRQSSFVNHPSSRLVVKRPGVDISSKYLQNQFDLISTGQTSQKIKITELFVGLLKEQHAMAEHGTLYRYKYADWMPNLLRSALIHESGLLLNPSDTDWVVKAHTMAEMLSLPLDHKLTSAVAENLNHPKWPVRMMAVYLLANSPDGGFDKVLNWTAKNDSNSLVRDMAVTLSAAQTQARQPIRRGRPLPSEPEELSLLRLE